MKVALFFSQAQCTNSKKRIFKRTSAVGIPFSEAVVQRCSVKKVFLEISQNSQQNICDRVSFLIKLPFDSLLNID